MAREQGTWRRRLGRRQVGTMLVREQRAAAEEVNGWCELDLRKAENGQRSMLPSDPVGTKVGLEATTVVDSSFGGGAGSV